MTKSKHLGANRFVIDIIQCFKTKNFELESYIYANEGLIFYVRKNYAERFNIEFDGNVTLEVKVPFIFQKDLCILSFPSFKEISNIIPKRAENHIYLNGSICFAPPYRPIKEKWRFIDFVIAVDSVINNYFSKEYIGKGSLFELEHGNVGIRQYMNMVNCISLRR